MTRAKARSLYKSNVCFCTDAEQTIDSSGKLCVMRPLPPRPLKACAVFAAIAAFLLLIKISYPDRNTVQYHLSCLASLNRGPFVRPKSLSGWLRPDTLRWYLSGRPTVQEWGDELEGHQQALIALGYYKRRWLPWRPGDRAWELAFTNARVWKAPYAMHFDFRKPSEIQITARPADLAEFELLVRLQQSKVQSN